MENPFGNPEDTELTATALTSPDEENPFEAPPKATYADPTKYSVHSELKSDVTSGPPSVSSSAVSAVSGFSATAAPISIQHSAYSTTAAEADLRVREENIKRREAKLLERERQLENREVGLEKSGLHSENWPFKCYPLAYHDIDAEIPEGRRPLVRRLYGLVLYNWFALFWNWLVILIVWFSPGSLDVGELVLWSSIYLVLGVPGSWKLWYRSVYYANRDSSGVKWVFFFVNMLAHMGFTVIMGLGVPSTAGAGLFFMFKLFTNEYTAGGLLALSATAVWAINLLASVVLIKKAHTIWKSSGGQQQLQTEVNKAAVGIAVAGAQHQAASREDV